MRELIEEFLQLKGEIPEHIRSLVVRRVARAIPDKAVGRWFVKACELEAGDPVAPPRVPLERDQLALFVDRWLHASGVKDPVTNEWRPMNADENCIRVTMCAELLELAGLQHNLR